MVPSAPIRQRGISIHAPLTGSDAAAQDPRRWARDFNPRSPYGERQALRQRLSRETLFQSTLPLRGATLGRSISLTRFLISIHAPLTGSDPQGDSPARIDEISIHAPLTGSDGCQWRGADQSHDFNPRSPYGERPIRVVLPPPFLPFQSTLPLRGATR